MRFVVCGGGTAGHVNPAIAVALELERRGHEVVYIGTPRGPEAKLSVAQGLEFVPLEAAGFNRSHPTTLVTSSVKVLRSARKAAAYLEEHRPAAVVGFGGYVSLPVGMAAHRTHTPLVIHEQNSVPGLTNRRLGHYADRIALTYEMSREYLKGCPSDRMVITGNPVRRSILEGDRARGRRSLGIPDDALMLLVMGGSLGAKHLNEALIAMRDDLMAIDDLYVVHSSGPRNHGEVVTALGTGYGDRWQVFPYIENMGDCLKASDCIVSRSGASSLAEITALGIASLLVPYPHATDDHQTKNARALVKAGACVLIPDDQLEDHLSHDLLHLLRDAELRVQMASSARELGRPNAVSLLADTVLEVAGGGQ